MLRWLAVLVLTVGTAQAAKIEKYPLPADLTAKHGEYVITVTGQIEAGDYETFRPLALAAPKGTLVGFESPGGLMGPAMQIGTLIRSKELHTIVIANKTCASACAVAWLGGVVRGADHTARIGFHAAYDKSDGLERGPGNAVLGVYLSQIGLPIRAIVYITKPRPHEMQWLSPKDAEEKGIAVEWWSPLAKPAETASIPVPAPVPARREHPRLEGAMRDLAVVIREMWAEPITNWSALRKAYTDRVTYHEREISGDEVIAVKQRFSEKWPMRSYKIRDPKTLLVSCDRASQTCDISGVMDWRVRNPAQNKEASGVSTFSYRIRWTGEQYEILGETTKLISEGPTTTAAPGFQAPTPTAKPPKLDPCRVDAWVCRSLRSSKGL